MSAVDAPFSCPAKVVVPETNCPSLLSPTADNTPATEGDGRSIERELASASGRWSNCDVHIDAPQNWSTPAGNAVQLRLYAVSTGGVRSLVAQATCDAAGLRVENGRLRGVVLSGRGHPGQQWLLVARTANDRSPANITLELWGDQSSPEGIGNTPGAGIFDANMPSRAAHLLGYNSGVSPAWVPLEVDPTTGDLKVTVEGTVTPGDAMANPTNAVPAASFGLAWNGITWQRIRITSGGSLLVGASGFSTPGDALPNPTAAIDSLSYTAAYNRAGGTWGRVDRLELNQEPNAAGAFGLVTLSAIKAQSAGGQYLSLLADGNRGLVVRRGLPVVSDGRQPSLYNATATAQTANVKASAGIVLGFHAYNLAGATQFFCLVNKASAAVNGDAILMAFAVPTLRELTITLSFSGDNGLLMGTGITWAWSSTLNVITLGTASAPVNFTFV